MDGRSSLEALMPYAAFPHPVFYFIARIPDTKFKTGRSFYRHVHTLQVGPNWYNNLNFLGR